MKMILKKLVVYSTIIVMNLFMFQSVVHAGIIDTTSMLQSENRVVALDNARRFVLQDDVARVLLDFGVDQQAALQRVSSLSDSELIYLSEKIDQAPAGAGVVEVVGIVFIVLIILELVGVTDIFKKL